MESYYLIQIDLLILKERLIVTFWYNDLTNYPSRNWIVDGETGSSNRNPKDVNYVILEFNGH